MRVNFIIMIRIIRYMIFKFCKLIKDKIKIGEHYNKTKINLLTYLNQFNIILENHYMINL